CFAPRFILVSGSIPWRSLPRIHDGCGPWWTRDLPRPSTPNSLHDWPTREARIKVSFLTSTQRPTHHADRQPCPREDDLETADHAALLTTRQPAMAGGCREL